MDRVTRAYSSYLKALATERAKIRPPEERLSQISTIAHRDGQERGMRQGLDRASELAEQILGPELLDSS